MVINKVHLSIIPKLITSFAKVVKYYFSGAVDKLCALKKPFLKIC